MKPIQVVKMRNTVGCEIPNSDALSPDILLNVPPMLKESGQLTEAEPQSIDFGVHTTRSKK